MGVANSARYGFGECGVAYCSCWPIRAGVYNCASGNIACILQNCHYHPGQVRGVFSSVELAFCLPVFRLHAPLLADQRPPPILLARATHHGFWPGVLKRLSPYTHEEWYLLDSTQLGAELLPLLPENMVFRLDLNLVQIQVVVLL